MQKTKTKTVGSKNVRREQTNTKRIFSNTAWGGGVDNSWANNSHAEMKFLYNPKEITYTDLAIWNNIFQWGYRIINTANMVISRADNDGINWGSGADAESRKNEMLAEARFFQIS